MNRAKYICDSSGKIVYIKEEEGEVFFAHNFNLLEEPDYQHISDWNFTDLCNYYGKTMRKM